MGVCAHKDSRVRLCGAFQLASVALLSLFLRPVKVPKLEFTGARGDSEA